MGALLKYRFVFLLFAAFGLAGADVSAQTGHFIRGVVRDSATGQPLVGVSVSVEETRYGAVTDGNGLFRVTLPSAGTYSIVFSHIGYEKELRRVTTDNARLVYVGMKMDVRALSPMVVTGTRTPKLLKDAPVITRLIGEDDIRTLDLPDVQDVLQAELPGIEFSYSMNQQVG
ncbi:MAG: carboxypeptidase-like regulatory domain-containing protein, partial [Bacteroidales bacterium]|nr:carboxypeptidase-like regulatory domain-containing protein [Bacteroidales bacterium]